MVFDITEIFEGLFDSIAFEKHCEKNSWEKTNENRMNLPFGELQYILFIGITKSF